jgi:hypothetical protein
MSINRTIVFHPRTPDVVAAAVSDTYLSHARAGQPLLGIVLPPQHVFRADDGDPLLNQKVIVATLMRTINEYNDLCMTFETQGPNRVLELQIAGKQTEIRELREQLWDDDILARLELTCDSDVFLEVLLSNVKGAVISFQVWVKKKDNIRKNNLIWKIQTLKNDFMSNSSEISAAEATLNELVNEETLARAKSMKIFDCLNAEKPTQMFLNLAKLSNSDKKLSAVCKPDGSPFLNSSDRNEYIVSYYQNLYKKPLSEPEDLSGCVEKFLGDDIVSSHIVQNSKLTEDEVHRLDQPLNIAELDRSMDGANLKSAPGIDGISNVFLKEFWKHFRWPLYNYCNTCL